MADITDDDNDAEEVEPLTPEPCPPAAQAEPPGESAPVRPHQENQGAHGLSEEERLCVKRLCESGLFGSETTQGELNGLLKSLADLRESLPEDDERLDDEDRTFHTTTLNDDTFSFIITTPKVRTWPLFTAIVVVVIKVTIFSLVIIGTLKPTKEYGTTIDIPAGLDLSVIIGQFVAIGITFLLQDDIRSGMRLLSQGFGRNDGANGVKIIRDVKDGRALRLIKEAHEGSSEYGYYFTAILLLALGILGLATTFLLIITTDDVVDLLLNFTAISFVAELDNAAFVLAKSGLIGEKNQKEANDVADKKYYARKPTTWDNRLQIGMLYLLLACQVAVWAIIVRRQRAGWYLPKSIVVQFDDFVDARHGTYSGVYLRKRDSRKSADGYRFVYELSRESRGAGAHPSFGYCGDQRVWTLFNSSKDNPCQDIIAKSSSTKAYDITDASPEQWYGSSDVFPGRYYPLDHFFLGAVCTSDQDCGGPGRGKCGGSHSTCECKRNFYGLRCDFQANETCQELAVDKRFEEFRGSREFSETYQLLGNATIHIFNHSIYTSETGSGLDLLIFTGLRWVIVHSHDAFPRAKNGPQLKTQQDLEEYLKNHTFNPDAVRIVEFASEPVRFNSPNDLATPIDLQWFLPRRNERFDTLEIAGATETRLICGICSNKTSPCFHGYTCTSQGTCECRNGAFGRLCERTPPSVGDGQCDSFFNTEAFEADGGDCCEHSCIGMGEVECGIISAGNDRVYRGYPHCVATSATSYCSSHSCWIRKSRDLFLAMPKQILLSSNGRILVVVTELEAGGEHVTLYDQVDSMWIQRGPEITESTLRISQMALATPSRHNILRKTGETPVTIATAASGVGGWDVCLYSWGTDDSDWHKLEAPFKVEHSDDISNLTLARGEDRVVVAMKVSNAERTSVQVRAFQQNDLGELWDTTYDDDDLSAFWLHPKGELMALLQASNGTYLVSVVSFKNRTVCATADVLEGTVASRDTNDTALFNITVDTPNSTVPPCQAFPPHRTFPLNMSVSRLEDDWQICVHTSAYSDDMTLVTLASRNGVYLFQVDIDSDSVAEAAQQIVEPLTFANMNRPQISLDCLSVGFYVEAELQVYRFDKHLGDWRVLGSQLDWTPSNFSLSADGSVIAVSEKSKNSVAVLQVNSSVCGEDENVLRIGIAPLSRPAETSWTVEGIQTVNGTVPIPTTLVRECNSCYSEDDKGFFIEEVICTPKSELGCFRITFHGPEGVPFIATLASKETLVLNDGSTPLPIVTVLEQDIELCRRQDREKECRDDQWLFGLFMIADEFGLRSWELQKKDGSPILSRPANEATPLGDHFLFQECIEASSGYRLVINSTEYDAHVRFVVFIDWEEQGPGTDLVDIEVLTKDDILPNQNGTVLNNETSSPAVPVMASASSALDFSRSIMVALFSMFVATLWHL